LAHEARLQLGPGERLVDAVTLEDLADERRAPCKRQVLGEDKRVVAVDEKGERVLRLESAEAVASRWGPTLVMVW
jgi:hypothetical protein